MHSFVVNDSSAQRYLSLTEILHLFLLLKIFRHSISCAITSTHRIRVRIKDISDLCPARARKEARALIGKTTGMRVWERMYRSLPVP